MPKILSRYLTMERSPRWEAKGEKPLASQRASQNIPCVLWNQNIHNISTLVPIVSKINPVRTLPCFFSKIYFNVIITSTIRISQWSPFLRFLHQNVHSRKYWHFAKRLIYLLIVRNRRYSWAAEFLTLSQEGSFSMESVNLSVPSVFSFVDLLVC